MQDLVVVGVLNSLGDGGHQAGGGIGRQGLVTDRVSEVFSIDKFQGNESLIAVRSDSEDLDDVRVLQPGNRAGLRFESPQGKVSGELARQDHLERDIAAKLFVPGVVDNAHPAATQLAQDRVALNLFGQRLVKDQVAFAGSHSSPLLARPGA